jgi:potassium/hydrogen antiporter
MDTILVFGVLAGIIFIGFFAEIIFRKTNIPDVLILIILGIFMGPVMGYVHPGDLGDGAKLFTTFALAFILFQGAINIDFKTLIKTLPNTFKLTIISFFLTVVVVTVISGFILKYDPLISLIIGTIIGGTSSAVVIPLVKNIEMRDSSSSVLTLESAISDVLCIVGTITVLEIINDGQFVASGIVKSILTSFSLALVVGAVIGIIWIYVVYNHPDLVTSYIITIALVIGLYAFVESPFVEASGAIAVLAFGLMLGNSRTMLALKDNKRLSRRIRKGIEKVQDEDPDQRIIKNVLSPSSKTFYSEISFFVKTFFFVYLGILMDFSNPSVLLYGALLTLGIYMIRPIAVKYTFMRQNLDIKEKTILEVLIPKGLAAAVLAQVVLQAGVTNGRGVEFVSTVFSVVLISIILTSVLVFMTERGWFKGLFWYFEKNVKE